MDRESGLQFKKYQFCCAVKVNKVNTKTHANYGKSRGVGVSSMSDQKSIVYFDGLLYIVDT